MRKVLILLCAALLAAHSLASERLLRDCGGKASGESVGLEALDADCPGAAEAVYALDDSAFISETQAGQLRRESFDDLLSLQARYRNRAAAGPALDSAAVPMVLQGLPAAQAAPVKPKGWFELVADWFERFFAKNLEEDNWLSRWLKEVDMSAELGVAFIVVLSLLILAAAITIVVIELRASGILLSRGERFATPERAVGTAGPGPGLADLEAAPIADRVPMLLKLLVAALRGAGRLEADQALTHRQLSAHARFDDDGQRRGFGDIAVLAERALYGGRTPEATELDQAMQAGRTLYSQLSQPSAVRSGGAPA